MRIGILSDTHQNLPLALKAIQEMGRVDSIVHLGDHVSDARRLEERTGIPFRYVRGNGDVGIPVAEEEVFEFGSYRVLATHGDDFDDGGQVSLEKALKRTKARKAQVLLFGHFHQILSRWIDGILVVNPGHMCLGAKTGSYGILELDEKGTLHAGVFEIENDTLIKRGR